MSTGKRILVATDFTDISGHASAYGVELARQLGAHVTFLHVYEIPIYSFLDGALVATSELAAALSRAADGAMQSLVAKYGGSESRVDGLVRVGSTADEVQRVAAEVGADMIVLGTHGRRGLARAFLGSVAEVVVRTSTRPVVVVPSAHDA